MRAEVKHSKQSTLDNTSEMRKTEPAKTPLPNRQIEITEITTSSREGELILKAAFKLVPSRIAFSRVTAELYFDEQKIDSLRLRILQGPLATDESEFSSVLDMTGIEAGPHNLKIEMYELWEASEKLTCASKEVAIEYVPLKREDKVIRVPIIKSTAGADLTIISDVEKNIYREINEEMKKDSDSRQDYW